LVRHNQLYSDGLHLRISINHHIIVKRCSFAIVYVALSHMQGGKGCNPSRLPPEFLHGRGTFVSCFGLYNAVHGNASILSGYVCFYELRQEIISCLSVWLFRIGCEQAIP